MSYWRLDLSCQKSGKIISSTKTSKEKWKLVSVFLPRDPKSNFTSCTNVVQPTAITFSLGAAKLYCAFQTGSIYILDFIGNKYRLLGNVGQVVTAICLHGLHEQLYVALSDRSLRILDEASGDEVDILEGHTTSISNIFIQPQSGKYALSIGFNEAILWNSETRQRKCKLHIETGITLASALFVPPNGEQIISCLRDGSLYVWNTETLECLYSLTSRAHPPAGYRTFAFTSEGNYMFAAGRSAFIDLWCLQNESLINPVHMEMDAKCDTHQERGLFERIQMPSTSVMIRTVLWISRMNLPETKSTNASDNGELDGYLMVLGNDHRIRLLIRTSQRQSHRGSHLSFSAHSPTTDDRHNRKSTGGIAWICLFTIGTGSHEDPLISDMFLPKPISLHSANTYVTSALPVPNGNSLAALIDVHGTVHVLDLAVTIKHFVKPVPNTFKVQDLRQITLSKNPKKSRLKLDFSNKNKSGLRLASAESDHIPTGEVDYKHDYEDPTGGLLDRRRLRLLLREFGHFPDKYRLFIWRSVLQLPNNTQAFNTLLGKGLHPAYEALPTRYPIRGQKLMRVLQKVCSCLAFWSPLFGETDWLPPFIFPFVKLFQNNAMHAFEVVATVLTNWCATWFEYFPNPPINILCMVENLLAHADPELYHHLVKYEVTTEIYAWPLLQTAFSEVFTQNEWLLLWDTLLCHTPGLMLAVVVAYAICARGPLLLVRNLETFETFFRGQNSMSVLAVVDRAHQIMASTPPDLQPDQMIANLTRATSGRSCNTAVTGTTHSSLVHFQPLTSPQYPIITRYPKFIVDFHIRERERIREEEKEYLKQRATVEDMQRRAQLLASEEESWYRQQALLLEAEERRRAMIAQEESKLREQRKRLSALIREVKLHELTLAEESHSRSRQLDIRRRKAELDQMEEQLSRLANKRTDEMDAASHAVELARLQEVLQQRRAETMALIMMTREPQSLIPVENPRVLEKRDSVDTMSGKIRCDEVTSDGGDVKDDGRIIQPSFRTKQSDHERGLEIHCTSTPTDSCHPEWVAAAEAVQSKDTISLMTSHPSKLPQTFMSPTMDQFTFTSTKLSPNSRETESNRCYEQLKTVKSGKLGSGCMSGDISDSEYIGMPFMPKDDSTPPMTIGELSRENQILVAEVDALLDRLKSQKNQKGSNILASDDIFRNESIPQ